MPSRSHAPRRRRARRLVAALLLGGAPVAALAPTSSASAPNGSATYEATLVAEAWYRPSAVPVPPLDGCGLPAVGCAPLPVPAPQPPSPYPARTLHVGVAASAEEARTYLTLVGASVPFDAELVGGTLTLPVATDPQAGSIAADTAEMRACLVIDPVKDGIEGGLGGAPAVDCATAAPATFVPGSGDKGPTFTVDLAPFATALAGGQLSLALVPSDNPGTAWHVAFSRRDRDAEGVRPITAQLRTAQVAETDGVGDGDDVAFDPPAVGGSLDGFPVASGLEVAPLPPVVVGRTPDSVALPADTPVPVVALGGPFKQPVVFLLPLALLGGVAWVARTFTRDLRPAVG